MEFVYNSLFSYLRLFLWALWFVVFILTGLILPGFLLLKRFFQVKDKTVGILFDSVIAGMGLWVLQGIIFGLLHIRYFTYIYVLIFLILSKDYIQELFSYPKKIFRYFQSNRLLLLLILLGVFGQMFQCFSSGFFLPEGWYSFIADDATYHLGLTGELVRKVPPNQPGLSGVPLTGYHYFSNLFIAEIVRVYKMPLVLTQFVFVYLIWSVLLGMLVYKIMRLAGFKIITSLIGPYLFYFSSDVIFFVTYITTGVFNFTVHPLEDGTMFLENPPRAFATILILSGIYILIKFNITNYLLSGFLSGLLFGLSLGAKVHNGIMIIAGILPASVFAFFKKDKRFFFTAISVGVIFFFIYRMINSGSKSIFWAPFEWARMFTVQEGLNLSFLELRRRIYLDHNNLLRMIQMDLEMLLIFLFAQFGIRWIGILGFKDIFRRLGMSVGILLTCGFFITMFIGTFFLQPYTGADIFNSCLAGNMILGLAAAFYLANIIETRPKYGAVIFLILAIMILPRWIYKNTYIISRITETKPVISRGEINAGRFIKENTPGGSIVFIMHRDGGWDGFRSYMNALTMRESYLSGLSILSAREFDIRDREVTASKVYNYLHNQEEDNNISDLPFNVIIAYKNIDENRAGLLGFSKKYVSDNVAVYIKKGL